MQRFDSEHDNGSQTLLRSARNNFYTTIPPIWDKTSSNRLVLVRSEVLGQLVNTLTADYKHSAESGEFIATSSNADISRTQNFFSIFYCISEMYIKFTVFWKKRSVS